MLSTHTYTRGLVYDTLENFKRSRRKIDVRGRKQRPFLSAFRAASVHVCVACALVMTRTHVYDYDVFVRDISPHGDAKMRLDTKTENLGIVLSHELRSPTVLCCSKHFTRTLRCVTLFFLNSTRLTFRRSDQYYVSKPSALREKFTLGIICSYKWTAKN